MKLPELSNSPKDKLLREDLPLKMSFSILRVSRTDAAEKHFVHILRHMEKDLSAAAEPMVIPVFGRGLALYAIVGKGITENNVADAATFLTSACSCEVKQLNPGVDLLMTVDWDGSHVPATQPASPPRKRGEFNQAPPPPPASSPTTPAAASLPTIVTAAAEPATDCRLVRPAGHAGGRAVAGRDRRRTLLRGPVRLK